ncbi:MAG TPA: IS66 family insertion sequence element accessory protein TnpB, partial [Rubrivivax sp.]|nr:IS66 family insertion sequence element accessory protein TnpB [Rubrivivax sp.]
MIALTARLRVWVATEPADFRCGIDGLARRVRQTLAEDSFSGALFVFRNRRPSRFRSCPHQYSHAPIASCDPGCDCTTRQEDQPLIGLVFFCVL